MLSLHSKSNFASAIQRCAKLSYECATLERMPDKENPPPIIPPMQIAAFREVVAENLQANLARSEAFERRATTLLGFVTAALTFLLAVVGVSRGVPPNALVAICASVGVLLLLASAMFAVRALNPTCVRLVSTDSIEELWANQKEHPHSDGIQVHAQMLTHIIEHVDKAGVHASVLSSAHDEAEWRSKQVRIASQLLVSGLTFLGLATLAELGVRLWT